MVNYGKAKIFMDKYTAIDKSLLQGKATTLKELLDGLKGHVFKKSPSNSPVTLQTRNGGNEPLTTIYKCSDCDYLHFESGYFSTGYDAGDIIFADKSDNVGNYISISELIELIENDMSDFLDNEIAISCSDDDSTFPMTMLVKCSEHCESVHIISNISSIINLN